MTEDKKPLTYAASGVDVPKVEEAKKKIEPHIGQPGLLKS